MEIKNLLVIIMKIKSLFVLILFILSNNLFSQTTEYNREFQVNSYTKDRQEHPSVAALIDGKFVFCWQSWEQDNSDFGIYAQLFSIDGLKYGNEIHVNSYTESNQSNPDVAALSSGGFVICWHSLMQDSLDFEIYAQIFDADGEKLGNDIRVNSYTNGRQICPSVISLTNQNFIICWSSDNKDGSDGGIFAQIFACNGERIGNEFQVNTSTDKYQGNPCLTALSDGKFVICWEGQGKQDSDYEIFAQVFDHNGDKLGPELQVNTYSDYWQRLPSISSLYNDKFVICWQSQNQDGSDYGIFSQIFDSSGTKIGDEFQVNTNKSNDQIRPKISVLSHNHLIICWSSANQDSSGYGIFSQLFDINAKKIYNEFQINNYTLNNQLVCDISTYLNTKFAICWESDGQDGSHKGVCGKYYLNNPIMQVLSVFYLLTPNNNDTISVLNPTFYWNKSNENKLNFPWELNYNLYLDNNIDFSSPTIIKGIIDTSYQLNDLTRENTYFWKVLAKNLAGDSLWSSNVNKFFLTKYVSVKKEDNQFIKSLKLYQNYPNPFNPATTIKYHLPKSNKVILKIYNISGQQIETLISAFQTAGEHEIIWHTKGLPSGIYICRLQAGVYAEAKKLLLQK